MFLEARGVGEPQPVRGKKFQTPTHPGPTIGPLGGQEGEGSGTEGRGGGRSVWGRGLRFKKAQPPSLRDQTPIHLGTALGRTLPAGRAFPELSLGETSGQLWEGLSPRGGPSQSSPSPPHLPALGHEGRGQRPTKPPLVSDPSKEAPFSLRVSKSVNVFRSLGESAGRARGGTGPQRKHHKDPEHKRQELPNFRMMFSLAGPRMDIGWGAWPRLVMLKFRMLMSKPGSL